MFGKPPELYVLRSEPPGRRVGGTFFVSEAGHSPGSMSRLLHLDEGANDEGSLTITQLLGVTHSRIRAPV